MTVLSLRTSVAGPDASLVEQLEEMRLEMNAIRRENECFRVQLDSLRRRLEKKETTGTEQPKVDDLPDIPGPSTKSSLSKGSPQTSGRQ